MHDGVLIEMPEALDEELLASLQPLIDAALHVAEDVGQIIRLKAVLENQDVHGAQMPNKKPRPKNKPKNHPDAPLVDSGRLMDKSNWTVIYGENVADVLFFPPEYQRFLAEKGRDWINENQMNEEARTEIEQRMIAAIQGVE